MIVTNRDQRPSECIYTAQQVFDLIDGALTTGRIRQMARGYLTGESGLGWEQFACTIPDDGVFLLPFPAEHIYSYDDTRVLDEFVAECSEQDSRYKLRLDRWYSIADIQALITRSERLSKLLRAGKLPKISNICQCSGDKLALGEEVAEALKAANGEPIAVDVPGFENRYVVVQQATYDAAMAALELQKNVELIRVGVREMEAGLGRPLAEAMEDIMIGFREQVKDVVHG